MDLAWFKDLGQLSKTGNFSQAVQIRYNFFETAH